MDAPGVTGSIRGMRIATWNINGLRARLEFVAHWLAAREPDVVGLQELKMTDDAFPHEAIEAAGYTALTHGQKSWNGVAILVKQGLEAEVLQRGLPGQEDFGARLITARVGELVYSSLYCPNGKTLEHDDYQRKLAWFDALIEHAGEHHPPDGMSCLGGDYNICCAPLDSWSEDKLAGSIFHTDAERERMAKLFELGYADAFRQLHPEEQAYSWWDYRGGAFHRKQGLRIDLLLVGAALGERLTACEIDREYRKKKDGMTASDHAPVWIDVAS